MFFCDNCDNMLYMKIEEIQEQMGREVKEKVKENQLN